VAAEDFAVIDNADVVQLRQLAVDGGRNLVIRDQLDVADPRGVIADRAETEANLIIV
jgi:hypothetical protein